MSDIVSTDQLVFHRPTLGIDYRMDSMADLAKFLQEVMSITEFTDNGDGTYTFENDTGEITIDTNANSISIDDAGNNFTSNNVEDALHELAQRVNAFDVVSNQPGNDITTGGDGGAYLDLSNHTLVDNGDGTYTWNDINGTSFNINTNEVASDIDVTLPSTTYGSSLNLAGVDNVQEYLDFNGELAYTTSQTILQNNWVELNPSTIDGFERASGSGILNDSSYNEFQLVKGGQTNETYRIRNTIVTNLEVNGNNLELTDSQGRVLSTSILPFLDDTDISNVNIGIDASSNLTIGVVEDGNLVSSTVDLTPVVNSNNSANGLISADLDGTDIELITSDGTLFTIDVSSLVTKNSSLTVEPGNILTLTDSDGDTVSADLSDFLDDTNTTNTSLSLDASNVLTLTDSDGDTVSADLSDFLDDTNTTNTSLTVEPGNILTLTDSDGDTVSTDLSTLLDDTNTTNTSLTVEPGNILTLTDSDGDTVSTDLSTLLDDTDISNVNSSLDASRILTISVTENGNTLDSNVDLTPLTTNLVYKPDITPGLNIEYWEAGVNAAPNDIPANIFIDNTGPYNSPMLHPGGDPARTTTRTTFSFNTIEIDGLTTSRDQWQIWGWMYIETDGTQLRDVDPFAGKQYRVITAKMDPSPEDVVVIKENITPTDNTNPSIGIIGPFDAGWHFILIQYNDNFESGVIMEWDNGGDGNFVPFSGLLSQTPPKYCIVEEEKDYVLQVAEFDEPQTSTCFNSYEDLSIEFVRNVSLDYDDTTNTITLTDSENNSVEENLSELKSNIVYKPKITPGLNFDIWLSSSQGGDGFLTPNDGSVLIGDLFTGSYGPYGTPTNHISGEAPNDSQVFNTVDFQISDLGYPQSGDNYQYQIWGWIWIDQDGTQLEDAGVQNYDEYYRIFIGNKEDGIQEILSSTTRTDNSNPPSSRSIGTFATLNKGWHFILVQCDDDTNSDFIIRRDNAGDGNFVLFDWPISATAPEYCIVEENSNYVLQIAEFDNHEEMGDCFEAYPDSSVRGTLTRRTTPNETHILDWKDKNENTEIVYDAKLATAPNQIAQRNNIGEILVPRETVFFASVAEGSVINPGFTFLPFNTTASYFYDPEGRLNSSSTQWIFPSDGATYEITTTMLHMDASFGGAFTSHRINDSIIVPLPSQSGNNFSYSFTNKVFLGNTDNDYGGICLLNSSSSPITLSGLGIQRNYWTFSIRRIIP